MRPHPQNFLGVGVGLESHRLSPAHEPLCPPAHPGADVASSPTEASNSVSFPSFFCLLPCRFLVMASFAQALVVGRVDEQRPAPPVGLDVVHHRCPGAVPGVSGRILRGALAAERLPQELRRAQVVRPDRQGCTSCDIPPRPGEGLSGACAWDSTPPGSGGTPRVSARPERLQGHGLSPPGKTKSAQATTPDCSGCHRLRRWSLWTRAQALRYSRGSPVRSVCTCVAGFGRSCLRGPSGVSPVGTPGRSPIHPSR